MTLKQKRVGLVCVLLAPALWFVGQPVYQYVSDIANQEPVIKKEVSLAVCINAKVLDKSAPRPNASQMSRYWLVGKPDNKGNVICYPLEGVVYADYPPLFEVETSVEIWKTLNTTELKQMFPGELTQFQFVAEQPEFSVELKLADANNDGSMDIVLRKRFEYDEYHNATEETVCAYHSENGKANFLNYGWHNSGRNFIDRLLYSD